jgi:hypothetical protein
VLEQINCSQGFEVEENIISKDEKMKQYFTAPSIRGGIDKNYASLKKYEKMFHVFFLKMKTAALGL